MAVAPVFWAQRKDKLFVKIDLPEVKNEKVELTEEKLTFSGSSNGKDYRVELEFYAPVTKEGAKWAFHGKEAQFVLMKKDADAAFWPRLIKSTVKFPNIKADWNKWVSESDDEEGAGDNDFGMPNMQNMDFSQFGGMPGMDGGDSDDDDEDMPSLENNS
eukprot:TRINITY_DN4825_c0_g1_i1.p1 TRINITY_DN4825_c0_g1~~TRINITY_DN4825_c0_g1_i1.p1  ORF type:complete len:159 (-),score=59.62 TRINITY_DN4825_c0_g1_i1:145-621(-)